MIDIAIILVTAGVGLLCWAAFAGIFPVLREIFEMYRDERAKDLRRSENVAGQQAGTLSTRHVIQRQLEQIQASLSDLHAAAENTNEVRYRVRTDIDSESFQRQARELREFLDTHPPHIVPHEQLNGLCDMDYNRLERLYRTRDSRSLTPEEDMEFLELISAASYTQLRHARNRNPANSAVTVVTLPAPTTELVRTARKFDFE